LPSKPTLNARLKELEVKKIRQDKLMALSHNASGLFWLEGESNVRMVK
jgi:hypothetical protein